MPSKISAVEMRHQLSNINPTQMGKLKIVIEEQYTPRDYLAQRYQVSLIAVSNNKRQYIAREGDLINPIHTMESWMRVCGLTTDDLIFKIR